MEETVEIDYEISDQVSDINTLEKYKEQFDKMLGIDISTTGEFLEDNLRDFIQYINSTSSPASTPSPAHQQAYALYVLAICSLGETPRSELTDEFYTTRYFPLLYSALSNYMPPFRKLLATQDSRIYEFVEEKASDIVGFSLAVYNLSANVIKSDTQKIFLKTFFIETSPYNIQDIHTYYYTQLQYIYYEYIKNKTKGLVPIEDLIELQQVSKISSYSRLSIYEQGIRNHRIKLMCHNSDTLKEIDRNYDRLRGRIISNKFVSLFKQSSGVSIHDDKTTLVYLNSMNLSALEEAYPLVCKLLRSIRVKSNIELFNDIEKLEIRDTIYHTTFNKLKPTLGSKVSNKLASHLAQSVTMDLVSGEYIDPRTMSRVTVNSRVFISQFQKFLLTVLESLETL